MTQTLAQYVHVRHPTGGDVYVFAPGAQPPEWAQELITNPKAWGEDDSPPVEEVYAAQTGLVPSANEGETDEGETAAPPKGGRRVGRQNSTARA